MNARTQQPRRRPSATTGPDSPVLSRGDHRALGAALDLFVIDPLVGSGLPLWLPKGATVRRALERYVTDEETAAGYDHVLTPHLGREELYLASGHLPYYRESMFPPMVVDQERFVLKPMNCPHHIRIFQARPRSYRDLPLRLAEFGTVYRYEKSGQLQGLTRVRGMSMNDAHVFCTEAQLETEIRAVLSLTQRIYTTLGLKNFWIELALHDPRNRKKYAEDPALWEASEHAIRTALQNADLTFTEVPGEAAFYGPKADIQMNDAAGHTFTVSTIQVDMLLPARLNVTYTNARGDQSRPIIIHRAPIGTSERFVAFLIEHFAGAFPLWLAPIQVRVLPVNEQVGPYADSVARAFRAASLRTETDASGETLPKKIRNAETQKIPVMAVAGTDEAAHGTVTLRLRGGTKIAAQPLAQAVSFLAEHAAKKSLTIA